jgi:hypothetical protein
VWTGVVFGWPFLTYSSTIQVWTYVPASRSIFIVVPRARTIRNTSWTVPAASRQVSSPIWM